MLSDAQSRLPASWILFAVNEVLYQVSTVRTVQLSPHRATVVHS